MRHGDKINNLSRTTAHRKALLGNLANALLVNKRIVTTLAKAKALRVYVEPLITKTKKNDSKEQISHNHRLVFSQLQNKEAVKELFTVIAPKVAGRPGGYTRIIKLGKRVGDNAETALIELVDFNEIYGKGTEKAAATTSKRTRRAGGGKKKAEVKEEAAPETPAVAEAAPEAEPEKKAE
ncbi:MAG: 50S ribosomal protein L17 [Sphingobacteriales bacterium]|nr:50S ribosomal protein L17 [Sphingobacteriales bacterium]OJY91814.1 MAG: 50S ribosomal protein L17 [Sphingobacteriales bacterium 44-15]